MGGEKWFDPDGMRTIANRLDQAADEADAAGEPFRHPWTQVRSRR